MPQNNYEYFLLMPQIIIGIGEVLKQELTDMNLREMIIIIPIFIFIVWIGIYPSTFLKLTEASTQSILQQVGS